MVLAKLPVPVPTKFFGLSVVGFCATPQQMPRAVTAAPPSLVIFPPLAIAEAVIPEGTVVAITGKTANVVAVTSFPYAVP